MRRLAALFAMAAGCACVAAQVPKSFDVISIRPTPADDWNLSSSMRDGMLNGNLLLTSYISSAYVVREGLIFGLPEWAQKAKYVIHAKMLDADPSAFNSMTREQRHALMASLLTERFHLRVHTETRILPLYELVIDKDAPKFSPSLAEPAAAGLPPKIDYRGTRFTSTAITIRALTSILAEVVDRTVIDKTGLTGRYDLALRWTPEDEAAANLPDAAPVIFTALREQLGLRLRAAKGPVEVLVVDPIEQPAEN